MLERTKLWMFEKNDCCSDFGTIKIIVLARIPVHVGMNVVPLLLESVSKTSSSSNDEGNVCSSDGDNNSDNNQWRRVPVWVHVRRWNNRSEKSRSGSRITQIGMVVDSKLLFKCCKRWHIIREWKTAVEDSGGRPAVEDGSGR